MEYQCFGAAQTVTGSCHSVTVGSYKFLIDCGMFQGSKDLTRRNYEPFGFNPRDYKVLLLTHAHLDHCGRIPLLVRQGFKGTIYCTDATRELARIVMLDAANIEVNDTERENRRREREGLPPRSPLFTEDDVAAALKLFEDIPYHSLLTLTKDVQALYVDAGHILGAASIKLFITEKGQTKIVVFSGDIGQYGAPLVEDPEPIDGADYVVMECTYGDRLHEPIEKRKQKLLDVILSTYKQGGKVFIPSFAIERAQELLYDINELVEKKITPKGLKVFIDSPMAAQATDVFRRHPEFFNKELRKLMETGDNPFTFPGLTYAPKVSDSIAIDNMQTSCIVIAGSGMCTAGRIKHHIKHNIWNPIHTFLFVGYQGEGTLGYFIKSGAKRIRLLGEEVVVKSRIASIDGYSGHADYSQLLTWLKNFGKSPKKVFLVHGEIEVAESFAEKVKRTGLKPYIPHHAEKIIM